MKIIDTLKAIEDNQQCFCVMFLGDVDKPYSILPDTKGLDPELVSTALKAYVGNENHGIDFKRVLGGKHAYPENDCTAEEFNAMVAE